MNYKPMLILMIVLSIITTSCEKEIAPADYKNKVDNTRMTIVLSAPSINDDYYADVHQQIIDFQIEYAKTVMNNDNIVVVADRKTLKLFKDDLPADILLEATINDIWMRDFTTVIPSNPVQFNYRPSYFNNIDDATFIQNGFRDFANKYGINYRGTSLKIDGGNIVDNNKNFAITTERFLEDNSLTLEEGQEQLKTTLALDAVAIIPYDYEVMGHADGMVMWSDDNTVLVNVYDEPFRSTVIDALTNQLPSSVNIVEVPSDFDDSVWDVFASACGVNLNSTVTHNHIYVPLFNNSTDQAALDLITANTTKTVHTVPASGVCFMGGSVRCLTWQIQGENARKVIEAAQQD